MVSGGARGFRDIRKTWESAYAKFPVQLRNLEPPRAHALLCLNDQAFFSKRVIQTKITAPTNATMMEPIIPPPDQIPNIPKIQFPKRPPRMPRMMSTITTTMVV
jgi:hypothetical protein